MRYAVWVLVLLIAAAIGSAGCTETPAQVSTVKVAFIPRISDAPFFIAIDEGYFTEQGIKIDLVKFQSAPQALPSLINGDIDVLGGIVSPGTFNAVSKGSNIKIVADKGRYAPDFCPTGSILVRKDLYDSGAVTTIAQLKGRTIGAPQLNDYGMVKSFELANLSVKEVNITVMAFPTIVTAFENRAIEGAVVTEPYVTAIMERGNAVILSSSKDTVPDFPTPIFFGPSILEKNKDVGKRFMVAYLKGVRAYNLGKTDRNVAIVQNYTEMDPATIRKVCWPAVNESGYVLQGPVMEYQDWLYSHNEVTTKINATQLFDTSYVDYAHSVLK